MAVSVNDGLSLGPALELEVRLTSLQVMRVSPSLLTHSDAIVSGEVYVRIETNGLEGLGPTQAESASLRRVPLGRLAVHDLHDLREVLVHECGPVRRAVQLAEQLDCMTSHEGQQNHQYEFIHTTRARRDSS